MHKHGSLLILLLLVGLVLPAARPVLAEEGDELPKVKSQVIVKDMHCKDCAKKIARKLYTVKAVKGVRAVVKTHTATVTPEKGKQPSPRAMWEAVEEAGFTPVKLVCPSGVYRKKPKK